MNGLVPASPGLFPSQTYLGDNKDVISVKLLNHDEEDEEIYLEATLAGFEEKMRECASACS